MKIAIVGGGVSGLVAARELHQEHDVTLYEAGGKIGGHCDSVPVDIGKESSVDLDLGFTCYYKPAYPRLCQLLDEIGLSSRRCDLSLATFNELAGRQCRGNAETSLILSPLTIMTKPFSGFWRSWRRMRRMAESLRSGNTQSNTALGEVIANGAISGQFVDDLLFPWVNIAWGVTREQLPSVPINSLLDYFDRHDMFVLKPRNGWRRVAGGADAYLSALAEPIRHTCRLKSPVTRVLRRNAEVQIYSQSTGWETYDAAVLAVHADDALRLLVDSSPLEREILAVMRYQPLQCLLHTDISVLPGRPCDWPSCTHLQRQAARTDEPPVKAEVHLYLNRFRGFEAPSHYLLSVLGFSDLARINPKTILAHRTFRVPIPTVASSETARRWGEINGHRRTYFCGAYWGDGLHESAVTTAQAVARLIDELAGLRCQRPVRH